MPTFGDVTLFFVPPEVACCDERRRVSSSREACLVTGGEACLVRREGRSRCGALIKDTAGYVACEVTGDDTPTAVGDCDISTPAAASERDALSRYVSTTPQTRLSHSTRHASSTRRNAPQLNLLQTNASICVIGDYYVRLKRSCQRAAV